MQNQVNKHTNAILKDNKTKSLLPRLSERFAQIIIIAVPVINVLWLPVISSSLGGGANLTYMDILLLSGWISAIIWLLFRKTPQTDLEKRAWLLVILVNAPIVLSPLASYMVSDSNNLLGGLLSHLKRIGLASILIPLSMQAGFPKIQKWFIASIFISVLLLYFGPPQWIDINFELITASETTRNTGLLFNPNTLAFVVGINILIVFAVTENVRNRMAWFILIIALFISILTFASSGSRGGTVGLIVGLLYYIFRRRSAYLFVVLWFSFFIALFAINTSIFQNSIFASRWNEAFTYQVQLSNLNTRIIYQQLAISRSPEYPIGAGINSIYALATDSIYFDYLSAMGYLGFLSIISFLGLIWKWLAGNRIETILARAVVSACAVFSLSGLGIASPFVSPLFFVIIGWGLVITDKNKPVVVRT